MMSLASSRVSPPSSRSGGQALTALVAAALERQPARARAHPGTKPVGAGALALLWLIGALHDRCSPPRAVFLPPPERWSRRWGGRSMSIGPTGRRGFFPPIAGSSEVRLARVGYSRRTGLRAGPPS